MHRYWMGRLLALLCALALGALPGCGTVADPAPAELKVFAAASLTDAFKELGRTFEAAHPGVRLVFNVAGTQQLVQQIRQGAPADVFASANQRFMGELIDAGYVVSGTARPFAGNQLVIIYPLDNPAGIGAIQDLARPGLKLDLAAKEVPAGQYALDVLDRAAADPALGPEFKAGALANVVSYEENVRAVLTKVLLGEVDAGIVYASDVSLDMAGQVGRLAIPPELNTLAVYPIAPLAAAQQPELAREFIAHVLSAEGQAILGRHGFLGSAAGRQ